MHSAFTAIILTLFSMSSVSPNYERSSDDQLGDVSVAIEANVLGESSSDADFDSVDTEITMASETSLEATVDIDTDLDVIEDLYSREDGWEVEHDHRANRRKTRQVLRHFLTHVG